MSETWFTSDTHFGHKNILEYEKDARPFTTVEEMNETLIDNWNATVSQRDTVYHLGDFAFGRDNIGIASRLNGIKKLVMGNHDTYDCKLYLEHFTRVFGAHFWRRCILTHIPVHPDNLGSRFFLNVHGHLHSKVINRNTLFCEGQKIWDWGSDPNYFNVSCEQHGLKPVHSSVIMERLKELDDGLLRSDEDNEERREGNER